MNMLLLKNPKKIRAEAVLVARAVPAAEVVAAPELEAVLALLVAQEREEALMVAE